MGRCLKYPDEGECLGHDCIDRVGTPCMFDKNAQAGTEDIELSDSAHKEMVKDLFTPLVLESKMDIPTRCRINDNDWCVNHECHMSECPDVTQYGCDMGTCPDNFDRENSACFGCSHSKAL